MRTAVDGAQALVEALRRHGGTVAELAESGQLANEATDRPGPPQIAASGPRVVGREAAYELLLEMILQGSRLHYESSPIEDPDLALLVGDQLYALGLGRLAALGDLDAITALAELISQLAQAHAQGEAERIHEIWDAGARAIGWGSS